MLDDDGFEDRLKEAARDYNTPPETPRDLMWERIVARREAKRAAGTEGDAAEKSENAVKPFHPFRRFRLPAAIAALIALGFGIGRVSDRQPKAPPAPVAAVEAAPREIDVAYRLVTTEHLSQSEAFLTLFRTSVRQGGDERLASATARQLLANNRLLLDSPAASEARTRLLLEDLEQVLAEIAQLSPQPRSRDLDLITEGLERGGVLSRLRTAVPSGASSTQGAL